jgi:hypothetical protein
MSQFWELESLGSILPYSASNCANALPGEYQGTIYPDMFPTLTFVETGISLDQDYPPLIRSSACSNFLQHPFPQNYISDTAQLDGLRENFGGDAGNLFTRARPNLFRSNDKQTDTTLPLLNDSTSESSLHSSKKSVIRFNPLTSN